MAKFQEFFNVKGRENCFIGVTRQILIYEELVFVIPRLFKLFSPNTKHAKNLIQAKF